MYPFKTILFATDFSETSAFAFQTACALARDYGSRIVAVHVAEPPYAVSDMGLLVIPTDVDRAALNEKLHAIRPADSKVMIEYRLAQGDPADEIVRAADDVGADVVVVGTHGRRGISRLLMGSVAELILRSAPCPVVTVRLPASPAPAVAAAKTCEAACAGR